MRNFGLIECIDEGYVKKRYPEIYKFGPERLGIHFKNRLTLSEYSHGSPIKQGYSQLDYFKRIVKAYEGQDVDRDKYIHRPS